MGIKQIIRLFEDGNVCVYGLKGRGKDMLFANVVTRRKIDYVSNICYGQGSKEGSWSFYPYKYEDFNCGENTYDNFITGEVNYYRFPYPDGTDLYLSDCGIYFPSQYCSQLDRKYPYLPVYMAISRHVGKANFHYNVQNLGRCWIKIREMSDTFIYCRRCIVIGKLVLQWVRIYDMYESAERKVKPFSVNAPLLANKEVKTHIRLQRELYECNNGMIKNKFLVYFNKSNYNTRFFKDLLEGGVKPNEK